MAMLVKNVVVFGDSYSDGGNVGRKTNGPMWYESLSTSWEAENLHSFAFVGATCEDAQNIGGTDIPSIKDQLELYYDQSLDLKPEETVYALWVGTNDVVLAQGANAGTMSKVERTLECIKNHVDTLYRVFNARHMLLIDLPPIDSSPYYRQSSAKTPSNIPLFNEKLISSVSEWNAEFGTRAVVVDANSIIADIAKNPSAYGIKDTEQAYWLSCQGSCTEDANDYLWWDQTHLTGAAHTALAKSIVAAKPFGVAGKKLTSEVTLQSPRYDPQLGDGKLDDIQKPIVEYNGPDTPQGPTLISTPAVVDEIPFTSDGNPKDPTPVQDDTPIKDDGGEVELPPASDPWRDDDGYPDTQPDTAAETVQIPLKPTSDDMVVPLLLSSIVCIGLFAYFKRGNWSRGKYRFTPLPLADLGDSRP
ncbi:hypothetical protein BZG36_05080 [Bifiguratus adelaidae]|uniref:Uncharacterized protein n=1 Tax=Bifiguratus adelaidae TaxID=1938954 RepID=A0A261XUM0_9FUNG|nr:hypothetical protein BZG36_05080 [Bifiguratus adelaidae]